MYHWTIESDKLHLADYTGETMKNALDQTIDRVVCYPRV